MKTPYLSFAALAALLVAGCGGTNSPAENSADQLDNAAAQSSPEAANVLKNEADQIRATDNEDPNAAQAAMQEAGNVQAAAGGAAAPRAQGAKPHRAGDPVPLPKLPAGQAMPGNSGSNEPAGPR